MAAFLDTHIKQTTLIYFLFFEIENAANIHTIFIYVYGKSAFDVSTVRRLVNIINSNLRENGETSFYYRTRTNSIFVAIWDKLWLNTKFSRFCPKYLAFILNTLSPLRDSILQVDAEKAWAVQLPNNRPDIRNYLMGSSVRSATFRHPLVLSVSICEVISMLSHRLQFNNHHFLYYYVLVFWMWYREKKLKTCSPPRTEK